MRLAAGTKVKALIVDDVLENRDLLAQMLAGLGCEVLTANDGRQGVDLALSARPDIVFMDIRMPVMDGVAAVKEIKSEIENPKSEMKVVCLSASALAHEEQRYRDAGFDDFIAKPFRFERLCECLERLLRVKFESAATAVSTGMTPELTAIKVPADLLGRLREAAERFSKTRLERCFDELEQSGGAHHELAGHLRQMLEEGDLRAVSRFLEQLHSE